MGKSLLPVRDIRLKKAVLMASKVLGLTQLQKLSRKNKIHTVARL